MRRAVVAALCAFVAVLLTGGPAGADPVRDQSWYLGALGLPELHGVSQGAGVTVAIVDTGVDATHPDLVGNVLPGVDLYDGTTRGQVDRMGHGTSVAALVAGHGHGPGNRDGILGVAPGAKILPITIKKADAPLISPDAIATGIDQAVRSGAGAIVVALSSSTSALLTRSVELAWERGVVVFAAGGAKADIFVAYPASLETAIAVTGLDRAGNRDPDTSQGEEMDLAAPSVDLPMALPGGRYATGSGTSFATAIAAGSYALLRAKYPGDSPVDVVRRLVFSAKDAGDPGFDPLFGWGALDLRAALTGPQPQQPVTVRPSGSSQPPFYPPVVRERRDDPRNRLAVWVPAGFAVAVALMTVLIVRRRIRERRLRVAGSDDASREDGPDGDGGWRRPPAPL